MSKENTEYDVRVALYDATKRPLANVLFFNDTELMLECQRVKVVRDGSRLYFHKADSTKGIKLTGHADKNCLQLWSDYSKVKDMEGYYDLKYDNILDLYYIDKSEKLSEHEHKYTIKGTKQLNHNPGKREKGETMTVVIPKQKQILTNRGQQAVKKEEPKKELNKIAATQVVVKALITLLKTQVEDNEEALVTIDALEKYI